MVASVFPGGAWLVVVACSLVLAGLPAGAGTRATASGPALRVQGDLDAPSLVRLTRWIEARLAVIDAQVFGGRHLAAPVDVHLMASPGAYRERARAVLGREPLSPFGAYSRSRRAIVADAGSSASWVLHELVHARLADDLPGAAAWWDEGLASLLESAGEAGGRLAAAEDFRLAPLQDRLNRGRLAPLEQLVKMDRRTFLGREAGTHVAQARYLCLWLLRRGQLARFHELYRSGRTHDPTGWAALRSALGRSADLDTAYRTFVGSLSPAALVGPPADDGPVDEATPLASPYPIDSHDEREAPGSRR